MLHPVTKEIKRGMERDRKRREKAKICGYCCKFLNGNATLDHVIPRFAARGLADNTVVCCNQCNTILGNYIPSGNTIEGARRDKVRYIRQQRRRAKIWREAK